MSHNAYNITPKYGRHTAEIMAKQGGSKSITTKGKLNSIFRPGKSGHWKYHSYIDAMVKDIGEAHNPKHLRALLHPKALTPPNYQELPQEGRVAIACSVGVRVWELSQLMSKSLMDKVDAELSPDTAQDDLLCLQEKGYKVGAGYYQERGYQPGGLTQEALKGWPEGWNEDLLDSHRWVARELAGRHEFSGDGDEYVVDHFTTLAQLRNRFNTETKELGTYIDRTRGTGSTYTWKESVHKNLPQYATAQQYKQQVEARKRFAEGKVRRYTREYKGLRGEPSAPRGDSALTTAQSRPSSAVNHGHPSISERSSFVSTASSSLVLPGGSHARQQKSGGQRSGQGNSRQVVPQFQQHPPPKGGSVGNASTAIGSSGNTGDGRKPSALTRFRRKLAS